MPNILPFFLSIFFTWFLIMRIGKKIGKVIFTLPIFWEGNIIYSILKFSF
jgi:hypothetical protein